MKFGKSLSNQIEETLPEWRDKFLSYKELKKQLKLIESRALKRRRIDGDGGGDRDAAAMTDAEVDFVNLLEDELEKFNAFFVEKEEEYIIRLKELQDRVALAKDWRYEMIKIRKENWRYEMIKIRKEIVDFHGEMVLLENYSALNYTGLVKILKKYDKRTGALLRSPFIQRVLQQPFFTTDLIYKLVKECERMLDNLFLVTETLSSASAAANVKNEASASSAPSNNDDLLQGPKELAEIEFMESLYMKSTISALRVLKEIRSKSSTVSAFSLPPLQISGLEDTWNKVPVLEEVAK